MKDSKIEKIVKEIGADTESYLKGFFQYFLFIEDEEVLNDLYSTFTESNYSLFSDEIVNFEEEINAIKYEAINDFISRVNDVIGQKIDLKAFETELEQKEIIDAYEINLMGKLTRIIIVFKNEEGIVLGINEKMILELVTPLELVYETKIQQLLGETESRSNIIQIYFQAQKIGTLYWSRPINLKIKYGLISDYLDEEFYTLKEEKEKMEEGFRDFYLDTINSLTYFKIPKSINLEEIFHFENIDRDYKVILYMKKLYKEILQGKKSGMPDFKNIIEMESFIEQANVYQPLFLEKLSKVDKTKLSYEQAKKIALKKIENQKV
ncbi:MULTISPECIES: hypothetical protein [Tissierellia]|uniref:hypothetical protein n=1 Tax=Peptoniphilaceae TaxID=1570339 RepID=UPI00288C4985|nr:MULTISPECIES: hypothetical protein [Tissierellia]